MATISENLEALKTAKTSIKTAIESKGQDLTNVPFTQYGEKIVAIQTGNIDLSQTTATAEDVLEGKEFFNASGEKVAGTYIDMLQQRVDISGAANLFYSAGGNVDYLARLKLPSNVSNMFNRSTISSAPLMDTSNCTNFGSMFTYCSNLKTVPDYDTSNGTNLSGMFQMSGLTVAPNLNTSKAENTNGMFDSTKITTIPQYDLTNVKTARNMFLTCYSLQTVPYLNTINCTDVSSMFKTCSNLKTIEGIDLRSVTSLADASNLVYKCAKLENLTVKNVRAGITIGSGTSYGHLLTLESLLNTIKELWTYTGAVGFAPTLTVGSANLEKLANVYVKLIPITDEMRAEDEYIDNKAPFVQCESTDEGAMLITEYVTTVKNCQLA